MIRFRQILAIAERDLRMQMKGRRALLLPGVAALLMLPISALPVFEEGSAQAIRFATIRVAGDVPEEVLALDEVVKVERGANLLFIDDGEGPLRVRGDIIPDRVREALDAADSGSEPPPPVNDIARELPTPSRSLFLSMIAASILTGSVTESMAGERQNKTLQAMLAAAISRYELVVGKWLAWAFFGGMSGFLAVAAALAGGRLEAGWWLLPFPVAAMATVALGMYLVRRASDVVGGATISLRVLPAALTMSALGAWFAGLQHPLLGAAVPLGGAIVAAGDTWPGAGPALVATASSLGLTAWCLRATANDLAAHIPLEGPSYSGVFLTARTIVFGAMGWWVAVAGPVLWLLAGNAGLTEQLPRAPGVVAGAIVLLVMTAIRAAKVPDPVVDIGLERPGTGIGIAAVAVGLALALTASLSGLFPPPGGTWGVTQFRIVAAVNPTWAGIVPFALAVAGQELVFRGWLQRNAGPLLATVAFVIVVAPLDPVRGAFVGAILALLTVATGSVWAAIGARVLWGLLATMAPPLSPWFALGIAAAVVGALVMWINSAER